MFYNDSNKKYQEAYQETLDKMQVEAARIFREEMGYSTERATKEINNKLTRLMSDLNEYEDKLKDDPDKYKYFVKNMKKEKANVERAKLAVMEVQKAHKKVEGAITDFQMDF